MIDFFFYVVHLSLLEYDTAKRTNLKQDWEASDDGG